MRPKIRRQLPLYRQFVPIEEGVCHATQGHAGKHQIQLGGRGIWGVVESVSKSLYCGFCSKVNRFRSGLFNPSILWGIGAVPNCLVFDSGVIRAGDSDPEYDSLLEEVVGCESSALLVCIWILQSWASHLLCRRWLVLEGVGFPGSAKP